MESYLSNVVIIGAGLGGCALALALTDQNIPVTIYESRPEISDVIPSGVVLTPNGLRVLDQIGVFPRIKDKCYIPKYRIFKNAQDETTKKTPAGDAIRYGYLNHRIWRATLFDEMRLMLKERGVAINFNGRFNGVVSDDNKQVTFKINDQIKSASLLIGADGISSSVRTSYIAPHIHPSYTGLVGILCHIKRSSISWPDPEYPSNCTIQDVPGAIFWIAEDPAGEDLMIARQVHTPELDKQDLAALQKDPHRMCRFYLDDYDAFGETARKIIDEVGRNLDRLYIWPFMKMPKLERWFSESGRVVLLGDGAHALPPSSGQGVNQALEDVYSFTTLLAALRGRDDEARASKTGAEITFTDALAFWQKLRQDRLDAVLDWTENGSNVNRLPEAERRKLIDEGKVRDGQYDDMTWLYKPGIYGEIADWVEINA